MTQATFGTITGKVLGSTMTVKILPINSKHIHRVYYYKGDGVWSAGVSGYDQVEIDLPLSLANDHSGRSFSLRLLLRTYQGDTQVGEDVTTTVTVTVPENGETRPELTFEIAAVGGLENLYLQGISQIQGSLSATAKFGATIQTLTMTVNGKTYKTPFLAPPMVTAGEREITATAIDNRGFVTTVTKTITVLPYYKPKLNAKAVRCNSTGTIDSQGNYLKILAVTNYAPLTTGGTAHNQITVSYRYKPEGATDYSQSAVVGDTAQIESAPLLDGSFSQAVNYTVQVIVTDALGSQTVSTISVPSSKVYLHRPKGGTGMGLGGYAQSDCLDIYWNVNARQGLTAKSLNFHGICNDANQAAVTGIYLLEGATNAAYPQGILVVFNGSFEGSTTAPIFQLLMATSGKLAARYCVGGTPQSWKFITS